MNMNRRTASSDIYVQLHTQNFHKYNPGSTFDVKTTFSITVVQELQSNKYILMDLLYMSLEEAYKKYVEEDCKVYPEPYQHLYVFRLDILKNRIISKNLFKVNVNENGENDEDKTRKYFENFCEEKYTDNEINYLENMMHIDDHLLSDWIVPSELDLRARAMGLIVSSNLGSWLVRRSSVTEQPNVKVRVITIKTNDTIRHYLFAHIDGLGYVLTTGSSGDVFPKIGENKTIIINEVFNSLPSLLTYMKKEGLVLDRMIKS